MYTIYIPQDNLSLQENLYIHYISLPLYLHYTGEHSQEQTDNNVILILSVLHPVVYVITM
jgi:hypothetical protein